MNDSVHDREFVEKLAEAFVKRYRAGERPSAEEYAQAHPEHAEEIRELFPALVMLEDLAPSESGLASGVAAPEPVSKPAIEQLGDYRIVREIGRGGMGIVYEAEQQSLGRRVALKVLTMHAAKDKGALERFRREARSAAKLHHTNIVPIFEVGQERDVSYYAMQLILGQGLDEVLHELVRLQSVRSSGLAPDELADEPSCATLDRADKARPEIANSLWTGSFEPQTLDAPEKFADLALTQTAGGIAQKPENELPQQAEIGSSSESSISSSSVATLPGKSDLSSVDSDPRHYFRSVAQIGLQVAEALAHAHARGIVHRDIKPSNLLLDTTGVVWVTDFGLAKTEDHALTHTGDIVGTIRYMSPERFHGACDARADIYALGLTLYEMLIFRPAFDSRDRLRLIEQISNQEPIKPRAQNHRIPADLETVVLKASDKDPRARYQTAEEMAEDLRRFTLDQPIRARRIRGPERLWRWSKRNPIVAALLAALVAAIAGGFILVTTQWQRADRLRLLAEEREREAVWQFEQSNVNFASARAAVDEYFTVVSETQILDTPGLESLRTQLLKTASSYYQSFLRFHSFDPGLQADTSAAQLRLAQITFMNGGSSDEWFPYFAGGVDGIEQLIRKKRDTPEIQKHLARIYLTGWDPPVDGGGTITTTETLRYFHKLAAIQEKFVADNPGGTVFQNDLAGTYYYLGRFFSGQANEESLRWNARAIEIWQRLGRDNPGVSSYRKDLARAYDRRAKTLKALNRENEASQAFDAIMSLRRDLARDFPQVAHHNAWLADCLRTLGEMQSSRYEDKEADKTLAQALQLEQKLVINFPTIPAYQKELAKTLLTQGSVLQKLNQAREAESAYRQALGIFERLIANFPETGEYFPLYQQAAKELAHHLEITNRADEGKTVMTAAALARYERLLAETQAESPEDRISLAGKFEALASQLRDLGRADEGEKVYRKGTAVLERLVQEFPKNTGYRERLGFSCRILCGLIQQPGRQQDRVRLLQEAIEAFDAAATDSPNVSTHRFYAADTRRWLGQLLEELKRFDEAEESYRKSVAEFQTLPAELLVNSNFRSPANRAFWNLIGFLASRSRNDEIQQFRRQVLEFYGRMIAARPNEAAFKQEWANWCVEHAKFLQSIGNRQESENGFREAVAFLEKQIGLNPESAEYRFTLANLFRELALALSSDRTMIESVDEYLARSLGLFEQLAIDFPKNLNYLEQLGHACRWAAFRQNGLPWSDHADQYLQGAVRAFSDLSAANPKEARYRSLLGDSNGALSWSLRDKSPVPAEAARRRAIAIFEQLVADYPKEASYRNELVTNRYALGQLLFINGKVQEAAQTFDKVLEIDRNHAPANNDLAWMLSAYANVNKRGDNREIGLARWAIKIKPLEGNYWNTLAMAEYRHTQWLPALDSVKKSMSLWERMTALNGFLLAMIQSKLGHKELARKFYDFAALWTQQNAPKNAELQQFQAEAAQVLGIDTQVVEKSKTPPERTSTLSLVLEMDPNTEWARVKRGNLYAEAKEWDKAALDFAKALEAETDDVSSVWLPLALLHLRAGKTQEYGALCGSMLDRFGKAEDPNVAGLVVIACKLGQLSPADRLRSLQLAEKFAARDPKNAEWQSYLGQTLFRNGDYNAAVEKLESSIRADPGLGAHWRRLFLAMAYQKLGRTADAQRTLEEVRSATPESMLKLVSWSTRLDLELMRQEAETLISEK